jgi:hypothetical protein
MSDFSNNHQTAPSAGIPDVGGDSNIEALPHVGSPGIAPESLNSVKRDAGKAEAASPVPATARDDADRHSKPIGEASALPKGTMAILAPQRAKPEAPTSASASASVDSSPRLRLSSRTAMVVVAAAIGGLAGSLATAGIVHLTTPESGMPSYYSALAEALGRVDHELTVLKSATESSTKATDQQVASIAERMDRTERAQAETSAKLAKAPDSTDRVERRLAAVSADVTGAIAESRAVIAPARPVAIESKPPSPAPIVDGWVVRDVYNGAAWIQGRPGIIQVIPGDHLPGLGRIEQVKRHDGKWVVVTSRGQIVSR